jgi:hypothetical protein
LPFDLDFTVSSAIALTTIQLLFPVLVPDDHYKAETNRIIDEMISKGNRVAELRKSDLILLQTGFGALVERERMAHSTPAVIQQQGLISPATFSSNVELSTLGQAGSSSVGPLQMSSMIEGTTFSWSPAGTEQYAPNDATSYNDLLAQIGLSSDNMTSLADQIDYTAYQTDSENGWLWDSAQW